MAAAGAAVLVLFLLQNLFLLGASRLRTIIYAVAAQGVVLSTLPALLHGGFGVQEIVVGAVALVLKGVFIPRMLIRALADLPIRREVEPLVGFKTCLVLGAIATSGSVYLATILPLAPLGGGTERMVVAIDQ
jgi:hydrogenase-4 component E